ncbi:SPT3 Dosage dependent suppressor of Ty-induced promoter mutations-like protein [Mortierella claussenii]|nr:SPT3 Dosage dependent suppressor of Ty-induced promoter mutations-like protein [Mortierella claussenii]
MPPFTATAPPSHHLTTGQYGPCEQPANSHQHQHQHQQPKRLLKQHSFSLLAHNPTTKQQTADTPIDEIKVQQQVAPRWISASANTEQASWESSSSQLTTTAHRLDVKTFVFKKELQEYVATRSDDRLRIETIIYVELSIVDQDSGSLARKYDYMRLPKKLFHVSPDKVMSTEDMASKRILDVTASVLCPSSDFRVEDEACVRCARRMSAKLEENESRIMHILPELYRTKDGDALINFRSGVANIQFKINCYCGHKKEKEGFVIRFEPQSDSSIASHVSSPLMFYHQNKNRIAARALAAAAKAQRKAEKLQQQQEYARTRSVVKSVNAASKREPRRVGRPRKTSPINDRPRQEQQQYQQYRPQAHQHHQMPSPPESLMSSPAEYSVSPELHMFIDHQSDHSFTASTLSSQPDPMITLFPELSEDGSAIASQQQQHQPQPQPQEPMVVVSHLTPNTGPLRGGTLVTVHGSGFKVDEMMYICFGETFVPVIPQHTQMVECFTPAWPRAETVAVFALLSNGPTTSLPAQSTFTYVDDNEKELIKLALQRIMSISAKMDGPLETIMQRANELTMWNDILGTTDDGSCESSSSSTSSDLNQILFSHVDLETMILGSLKMLDSPMIKSSDGLSMTNSTGHTMLHLSTLLQFRQLTRDLIDRGIDHTLKDKNGCTALDLARLLKDQTMINVLRSSIAKSLDSDMAEPARPLSLQGNLRLPATLAGEDGDAQMNFEWEGLKVIRHGGNFSSTKDATTSTTKISKHQRLPVFEQKYQEREPFREGDVAASSLSAIPTSLKFRDLEHQDKQPDLRNSVMTTNKVQDSRVMKRMDPLSASFDSQMHQYKRDKSRLISNAMKASFGMGQNHDRLLPEQLADIYHEGTMVSVREAALDGRDESQLLPLQRGGRVVVARRRHNDNGSGLDRDAAAQQAVVQNSRNDVESEPVLFLGGQPVVMTRSSPTTALSNQPHHHQERDEKTIRSGLKDGSKKRSVDDGEATVA